MYLQVHRSVIEPYDECRSNHDVICALGQRLGSNYPGFYMSGVELIDESLMSSGLPGFEEAADMRWIDMSVSWDDAHFLNGFGNPDAKFHFSPDWSKVGVDFEVMPKLPDHLDNIDEVTDEKPFRLVVPPARRFLNSTFTEMPSSRAKEEAPRALMHTDACQRLGLKEGDWVKLGNEQGEVAVPVRPAVDLRADTVIVEGIWPANHYRESLGINVLVSADRGPPGGGGVFHDTSIWVRPA